MSKWPVVTPPHPPLRTNLRGALSDPATYDGLLNVLIELHGTAAAANNVTETKQLYDELHPVTPAPPPPVDPPPGQPIAAGKAINYDKGVVDTGIRKRIG